jgi:hypothetical protein
MMKTRNLIALIFFLLTLEGMAQEADRDLIHQVSFKTQYMEIKDVYNYGLAHRGLNLAGAYTLSMEPGRNRFSYDTEISFGVNYNQGIGMAWSFKPIDLFYGFRLNNNPDLILMLGPYLSGYYQWQLYPELQSGHMLWFSSYETGVKLWASHPLESKLLTVFIASSLFSVNSRPQTSPETYFYSLTFNDFVSNVHSDMKFGSLNVFRHFQIQLALSGLDKRFRIGYQFEYMAYSEYPEYQYLIHSLNLTWQVGNKNKN